MDLLRIGPDTTVNLDRLSVIAEDAEGRVQLVLGDTTLTLDRPQSDLFRAFVASNYRIRELAPLPIRGSRGGIEPAEGDPPARVVPAEPR